MPIIEEIFLDISEDRDYDYVVDIYTKNYVALNNVKTFVDEEEFIMFLHIHTYYITALFNKNRYNDSIDIVDKTIPVFNYQIDKQKYIDDLNTLNILMLFYKARSHYYLQDYKNSTHIFRQLIKMDDKNENYKNWLRYSIYEENSKITSIITYCIYFIMIIMIFFKNLISDSYIRILIASICLLGLASIWAYDYYIKKSFRKEKIQ